MSAIRDPFGFATYTAFRCNPPKEVKFLWGDASNGLMQEQSLTMVHGGEKMGKTLLVSALAIAAARGDDNYLGFKLKEGGFRTLIIQNEVHLRGQYERFETMLAHNGLTDEQASRIMLNTCRNISLYDEGAMSWFRLRVRRWKPDLVIIDPLARLITSDENDNAAVGRALAPLLALRDNPGLAILVVHHDGKVGESTIMRPAHQRSRGANRLTADPDSIISLTRLKGSIRLSCLPRYGKIMEPIRLRINDETLTFEPFTAEQEHGEVIRDLVAECGGEVDEATLIALVEQRWDLKDSQARHRTAKARIKAAVEAGYIDMMQRGNVTLYKLPQKEET